MFSFFRKAKAIIPSNYSIATLFAPVSGLSQSVTESNAMKSTTVYGCVKVLSESVATLPLNLYNETKSRKEKVDGKITKLLKKPNSFMTDFDFKSSIMVDLALRGNSYWQLVKNGLGEVKSIFPLNGNSITVKLRTNGDVVYEYTGDQGTFVLDKDEVLHFKMMSIDGINGISPISYNQLAIATGMSQSSFTDKYFANGANSNVVLSHPAVLSDEAYDRLKGSFKKQYQGVSNSFKPILLEDGMKIEKLSMSNSDSQFIESRTLNINEVASIFRVPSYMINEMSRATFSNIEHQGMEFVRNTLQPYLTMMCSELNDKLLSSNKQFFEFDTDPLIRGDLESRYRAYQVGVQSGFLSPNEVRSKEGFSYVDGLDVYMQQLNMTQVSKDGTEVKGVEKQPVSVTENVPQ